MSIIDNTRAKPLIKHSKRMPVVLPKMNHLFITNFKFNKILSNTPKFKNLSPTSRVTLGNAYTPKTPPFQHISLYPSNPNRSCAHKQITSRHASTWRICSILVPLSTLEELFSFPFLCSDYLFRLFLFSSLTIYQISEFK
jgi:hypothetical protein